MNNGKITRKPKSSNNGDSNALDQDGESNEGDGGVMDSLLQRLKAAAPTKGESASARKKALMRKQILESQRKRTTGLLAHQLMSHLQEIMNLTVG